MIFLIKIILIIGEIQAVLIIVEILAAMVLQKVITVVMGGGIQMILL